MRALFDNEFRLQQVIGGLLILILSMIMVGSKPPADQIKIQSPDKSIKVRISNLDGKLFYQVKKDGQLLIFPSSLGLQTNKWDITKGKIEKVRTTQVNKTWTPIFGMSSKILNHYYEGVIPFKSTDGMNILIVFRVFDNGVAFRYEIPEQMKMDSITITKDLSEFRFGDNYLCFPLDNRDIEDVLFVPAELKNVRFSLSPMLVKTPNSFVTLNEAAIYDMSMMYFVNPDKETLMRADIAISKVALPAKTPWRVIQIGDKAGDIVESDIIANLNEPCDKEKFSWVKPGKSLWDHRNNGDTINGFVYRKNEESLKRHIDFASQNNLKYVLIDAGWYSRESPMIPRNELNIPEIIKYGAKKNIGIILYIDRSGGGKWDLDEVLSTYEKWGAAGIKYGYLSNEFGFNKNNLDRQGFVKATRTIIETCAKHKLLLNFHDRPVQPGGEQYTWPNLIILEYCHAQQDGMPVPGDRNVGPHLAVSVPFTNGLNGPLDLTNGFYDLNGLKYRRTCDPLGIESTLAGETARCLVNYCPMLILGDNGDVFNQKDDLFEFIKEMPDTWDESKVLEGDPGNYIIVARRSGENWFVAGNTDEEKREFSIPLDFLDNGNYGITLYLDAKDTHYQSNKEAYDIKKTTGTKNSIINVAMAPGGGFCMKITRL